MLTAAQHPLPGCEQGRMRLTRVGMKEARAPGAVVNGMQVGSQRKLVMGCGCHLPSVASNYFSMRLNNGAVTHSVITGSSLRPSRALMRWSALTRPEHNQGDEGSDMLAPLPCLIDTEEIKDPAS